MMIEKTPTKGGLVSIMERLEEVKSKSPTEEKHVSAVVELAGALEALYPNRDGLQGAKMTFINSVDSTKALGTLWLRETDPFVRLGINKRINHLSGDEYAVVSEISKLNDARVGKMIRVVDGIYDIQTLRKLEHTEKSPEVRRAIQKRVSEINGDEYIGGSQAHVGLRTETAPVI
ncbi:MAG TPA: hypothetical protein VND15_00645 [Candidatus Acidoferrales bacterium]|nr:hypothetical protein [Candidatus Acidoferrales bacterium]